MSSFQTVVLFPKSKTVRHKPQKASSTARGKATAEPKGTTAPPADSDLISNCVAYARAIAGFQAGWDVDPDGNSELAANAAGLRMEQHAKVLLAKITDSPAQTARDLEAKARMVPFILLSAAAVSRSLHGDEVDFFEAFASEVKQFLQARPHPIEAAS